MFDFGWTEEDHAWTDRWSRRLTSVACVALAGFAYFMMTIVINKAVNKIPAECKEIAPPQSILIRGQYWAVIIVPQRDLGSDPSVIGDTLCGQRIIRLADSIHGFRQRENLLHELFHAGVCVWSPQEGWKPDNAYYRQMPSEAVAHPAIYAAEQELTPILQDNPELIRYLGSHDPQ